jgi:hypothetical protein
MPGSQDTFDRCCPQAFVDLAQLHTEGAYIGMGTRLEEVCQGG